MRCRNGKISRLRGRSQPRQDEVPLTKLKLLGNLPQPRIFKQLRQEVLGEHSSVAKCSHRGQSASRRGGRLFAWAVEGNQCLYRLRILSIMPEVDWPFS